MSVPDGGGAPTPPVSPVSPVIGLTGLTGFGGLLASVGAVAEIVIDHAQVGRVHQHLDAAQQKLDEVRAGLHAISAPAVGGSPVGQQLRQHSALAHDAMLDTVDSMQAGLTYYRESITALVDGLSNADEIAGANARSGEVCIPSTPAQAPPPDCGGA